MTKIYIARGYATRPSSDNYRHEDGDLLMWRIGVRDKQGKRYASRGFGRKRDAEIALEALVRAGIVDFETMIAVPREERNRIMCENLPW